MFSKRKHISLDLNEKDLLHPLFTNFIPVCVFNLFFFFLTFPERRLAHAQAGMFSHGCFWGKLESLRDCQANCKDSGQTGEEMG